MSEEKLNINQWAEEDRPREKLMRLGADALTNAELLAIKRKCRGLNEAHPQRLPE